MLRLTDNQQQILFSLAIYIYPSSSSSHASCSSYTNFKRVSDTHINADVVHAKVCLTISFLSLTSYFSFHTAHPPRSCPNRRVFTGPTSNQRHITPTPHTSQRTHHIPFLTRHVSTLSPFKFCHLLNSPDRSISHLKSYTSHLDISQFTPHL